MHVYTNTTTYGQCHENRAMPARERESKRARERERKQQQNAVAKRYKSIGKYLVTRITDD